MYSLMASVCMSVCHGTNSLVFYWLSKSCTGSDLYAEGPKAEQKADDWDVLKKEEKCGGMAKEIELAVGARLMLPKNLASKKGLVTYLLEQLREYNCPGLLKINWRLAIYLK